MFTGDFERGVRFARGIVAGMTHINDMTVDDQPNAPFGGEKNSGLGRFNGEWAMDEFTRAHCITLQYEPHPYRFNSQRSRRDCAVSGYVSRSSIERQKVSRAAIAHSVEEMRVWLWALRHCSIDPLEEGAFWHRPCGPRDFFALFDQDETGDALNAKSPCKCLFRFGVDLA